MEREPFFIETLTQEQIVSIGNVSQECFRLIARLQQIKDMYDNRKPHQSFNSVTQRAKERDLVTQLYSAVKFAHEDAQRQIERTQEILDLLR